MSASEGLRRDLRCAVDKTHRLLSNMTIRCNRCTRKRFRWYQMHFIRHFVPRKRFKWNQVSSMMRFVLRKRFRRNKSGNHTVPQVEVIRTYAGFHSPISRFFVHHVGRFPLPKVSRRHSPRQAGFVHHVGGKKRSGEVAPRSWRDAATTRFRRH